VIILTLRTDKPESEIGLYDDETQLIYEVWQAHRQLAETIHIKIKEVLNEASKDLGEIQGVICFKGPGSFTGLRIGLSAGNALAYALNIPIIARQDPKWLEAGIKDLLSGKNDSIAIPEYGTEAKTTKQLK
jgi:tRNA threonylcarbamoyladenosine biosynthesis protein TsaB